MREFRLIGAVGARYAFRLITLAPSPIFRQGPASRAVACDPDRDLLDETTYGPKNRGEASAGGGVQPVWRAEYAFTQQWRPPRTSSARPPARRHGPSSAHEAADGNWRDRIAYGLRRSSCAKTLASSTPKMPVRKIPSKVPAPPIEAIGAPRP